MRQSFPASGSPVANTGNALVGGKGVPALLPVVLKWAIPHTITRRTTGLRADRGPSPGRGVWAKHLRRGLGLVAALGVWAYEGGRGGGGVRVRSTRDRPPAGWWRVTPRNRPLRAEWCAVDLVLWAQVSTLSRTANGRHTTSALLHARG